jgi:ribosomal protein S12 methylthiotransferase accessory factor
MRKRALRSDHLSSKRSRLICFVGAQPDDALGLVLKKVFASALFFPNQPTSPPENADLLVGIYGRYDQSQLEFARWAHDADVAAFCVQLNEQAGLIGPLTLSGRAGCGRCAYERLVAAAVTADHKEALDRTDRLLSVAAPVIVREIKSVLRRGPQRSQLLDHVLVVNAESEDESLHKVIPLARCPVCGGAEAFPGVNREQVKLSPEDSPEVVLGALAGWVDQRTGIISNLYLEPPDEPTLALPFIATAAPPHLVDQNGTLRRLPVGWGKGLTISGAVLSAVGEAIERYSAFLPNTRRLVWERPLDLDREFIDPRDCCLYTEEQYQRSDFPYVRFDENVRHPWVPGNWLGTNATVWVPAVFVFLSFEVGPEHLICQGTSNGLAASTDANDAALRAIMELVERDAFMATWLSGSTGQRVELDETLDPLLRGILEGIESLGATVEIYLLPTSVCGTTVLCLALGDGDQYPGVTFGLGTDLNPRAALRQALLELGQTGPYLRRLMRAKALVIPEELNSVRDMLDHAAYYFPKERAIAFNQIRTSETRWQLRDFVDTSDSSLETCASVLKAAAVRVAVVDVTSADVATGPFRVMRAVSPDLQPIWYGYGLERNPVERVSRMKSSFLAPPINPIW